ncbi:uncharacterized protein [Zea mays]|uniref:uncharacterized protein n=1 Tax=Zea mays TaxID=4577 RepID=UPI0004DE8777|nr:uncharacterized protein LOC111591320 [Zea mays]|eukprot:XP_023158041.1 uncharacterized protein LOC111591320 [Zea mays]
MPSIPCFLAPAATLYLLVSKLCSSELLCSSSLSACPVLRTSAPFSSRPSSTSSSSCCFSVVSLDLIAAAPVLLSSLSSWRVVTSSSLSRRPRSTHSSFASSSSTTHSLCSDLVALRTPHTRQAVVLGVFSLCGLTGSSRFIGLSRVRAELPEEVDIKEKFAPLPEYPLVRFHLTGDLVEEFWIFFATKEKLYSLIFGLITSCGGLED